MGLSIQEYRSRIGNFLPNGRIFVQNKSFYRSSQKVPTNLWVSLVVAVAVIYGFSAYKMDIKNQISWPLYSSPCSKIACTVNVIQISSHCELSNFYARYLYGNKQAGGIRIAHLIKGKGYLVSKKFEVEKLLSDLHPHVLGISEADYFKNHDIDDIKFTDYALHTCSTLENPDLQYSRIVVYTHKSLVCKPRTDLMNKDISSIWLQMGLPNQKQILVCQVYREWQLLNQDDKFSSSVHA